MDAWSGRFGVVSGRYHSHGENDAPETTIELFGRCEDGASICLLVSGLRPTFEIATMGKRSKEDPITDAELHRIEVLRQRSDIVDVRGPVWKWTDLGEKPIWTVEAIQPFNVPSLRTDLMKQSWMIYSGDIPFVNRLFLDNDIGMHLAVEGHIVDSREWDDEDDVHKTNVLKHGGVGRYAVDRTVAVTLENVKQSEPFAVPWRILSYDLETSIAHNTILCAAVWVEDMATGVRRVYEYRGAEDLIMEQMTKMVRDEDPDIITGYNIDNFDFPRMVERMEHHTSRKQWKARSNLLGWGRTPHLETECNRSRTGVLPRRQSNRAWNLGGRAIVDAWWQARQALKPQRETLSFISQLLFPDQEDKQKMDIDASNMDVEWANRPDEVMEYCVRDAALPLDILHAIQAIRRKEAVAAVAKVPFETASNGSTSQLLDSLVVRLADRREVAVPLTGSAEAKEGQITGGYVHDVEAGLHPWIAVLDFKSMYPSIMIGHNVCYTTRIDPSHPEQPGDDDEIHTSPTEAKFWSSSYRKGLVPTLLEDLMGQRDEHKALLKQARNDEQAEKEEFHDAMQYAVKILMNSFYGVFASGFYRFTHKDLGSSITAWARHNIKAIIQKLDEEGHHVVYSDTDSIFVRSPVAEGSPSVLREDDDQETIAAYEAAKQAMIDFGLEVAQRYSKDSAVLEYEKGLSVFFSHGAKKRYVGQVVYPSEEMLIRGYETQRTDSFEYLTTAMKQMFQFALNDERDALIQHALETVAAVKKHEVPARRLILAKSCKGRVDSNGVVDFTKDYARPESMAQVRAAKILIERGLGFTPGMKISYVVSNASNRPMQVHPWIESEDDGGIPGYDGRFYAERLAAALGRITETFGWTAKDLFGGHRQTSLFSF